VGQFTAHAEGHERIWLYIVAFGDDGYVNFWHMRVRAASEAEAYRLGGQAWDALGRPGFCNDYVIEEGGSDDSVA